MYLFSLIKVSLYYQILFSINRGLVKLSLWQTFLCNFQIPLHYRDASVENRVVTIRAQVTTEAPATKVEKISKKQDEGVIINTFKPKNPYTGICLLNTKITGDDAPGETNHIVFTTEGLNSFWINNYTCAHIWMSSNMYPFSDYLVHISLHYKTFVKCFSS